MAIVTHTIRPQDFKLGKRPPVLKSKPLEITAGAAGPTQFWVVPGQKITIKLTGTGLEGTTPNDWTVSKPKKVTVNMRETQTQIPPATKVTVNSDSLNPGQPNAITFHKKNSRTSYTFTFDVRPDPLMDPPLKASVDKSSVLNFAPGQQIVFPKGFKAVEEGSGIITEEGSRGSLVVNTDGIKKSAKLVLKNASGVTYTYTLKPAKPRST